MSGAASLSAEFLALQALAENFELSPENLRGQASVIFYTLKLKNLEQDDINSLVQSSYKIICRLGPDVDLDYPNLAYRFGTSILESFVDRGRFDAPPEPLSIEQKNNLAYAYGQFLNQEPETADHDVSIRIFKNAVLGSLNANIARLEEDGLNLMMEHISNTSAMNLASQLENIMADPEGGIPPLLFIIRNTPVFREKIKSKLTAAGATEAYINLFNPPPELPEASWAVWASAGPSGSTTPSPDPDNQEDHDASPTQ